jgi:hypothetical protein
MYTGFYFLAAGVLSRMFIPWFVKMYKLNRDDETAGWSWEWRYLRGQALATIIIGLGLPVLLSDIASVGSLDPQAAFLAGYGVAAIGRFIDKSATE